MFSRATIMDAMSLLKDINTHSTLDVLLFRYGLNEVIIDGMSKNDKAVSVAKYLFAHPEQPGIIGNNLTYELVEHVIETSVQGSLHFDDNSGEFVNYPQLRRLLLKDGFVIEEGKLTRTFQTDIDFYSNETLIDILLIRHNLSIAKGHYDQATNAFNRGDWAACNSQLRSYTEALMCQVAEKLTDIHYTDSHLARIALSQTSPPIFYTELNEWLNNGTGYFEAFWKRLHPHGSHPGLSSEEDAVFRLNLVQISSLEILRRYDRNFT
ncbi:hypothetical protein HUB98_13300 [Paenibacillus barcinonensis]|uniref:Uncharacterized protein n=1 Tax=Paenibacillus barcinonensis TaxID=198119 RepID=A0A2V4W3W3_PAEBA|nr:hypothetical protein [Paenibacillus barcinonensis]PYE42354.1 hypothetical protein DFQ00_1382 [Paenibacillus barcinonensis]QKS57195.1 hypothetical protein HUB98_13300 [Paenibacillus barcinonensis]